MGFGYSGWFLTLVVFVKLNLSHAVCPTGFYHNGASSCYRISDTKATWVEAKSYCEAYFGGHLVTIETQTEQNLLEKYLRSIDTPPGTFLYTGMTDAVIEGDWVWVGNKQPVYFTEWAVGEPNEQSVHHDEDCMVLIAPSFRWFDTSCYNKRHYICETSA